VWVTATKVLESDGDVVAANGVTDVWAIVEVLESDGYVYISTDWVIAVCVTVGVVESDVFVVPIVEMMASR
jgi:hypothetical protein